MKHGRRGTVLETSEGITIAAEAGNCNWRMLTTGDVEVRLELTVVCNPDENNVAAMLINLHRGAKIKLVIEDFAV